MLSQWTTSTSIEVISPEPCAAPVPVPEEFGPRAAEAVGALHRQVPGYAPTPLLALDGLARELGVKKIYVKNEAERFGLHAFKGLGGVYGMFRILCERYQLDPAAATPEMVREKVAQEAQAAQAGQTEQAAQEAQSTQAVQATQKAQTPVFVSATDGNHGRGVAWAGGIFGCRVHIYMPVCSAEARAQAIREAGPAEVTITDLSYDEAVGRALEESRANGWYLIQDTAWDGYEQIPTWIMQGYLTMAAEADAQLRALGERPTHLFLQAGAGSLAGSQLAYFASVYGDNKPVTAIVEPDASNAIFRSAGAGDGTAQSVPGAPFTIMAGLNCGTPCSTAWPILRDWAEFYLSCPDFVAAQGMRLYAQGTNGDPRITAGESGAATLGALSMLCISQELKGAAEAMHLSGDSVVLLFNTEGNTDPVNYRDILENGKYPLPADL